MLFHCDVITMYFNTYALDHVYFSMTRFYMSCMEISAMAVIIMLFMLGIFKDKKENVAIFMGSILLFTSALILVRTQKPIVGDLLWLKGMIPPHSIK